ncbi:MAG: M23 family metallopeptidase [Bacteroidales bacterium]|nr:M23 family metallopeptidase [Bacteroidales bacterium]
MGKTKYRFNTQTLQVEEVRLTFKDYLKKFLSICAAGLVFASGVIFLAYTFFESPKERMLERELEQFKLQYEVLNDRMNRVNRVLSDLQDRDDNIYRVILEAEPIPSSVRKAGVGGTDRYARLDGYKNSEIIINTTKKLDKIERQLYVQSKSFDEVFNMAKNKENMLAALPAIQPMKNRDLKRLSSYFGYRTDPFYKVKKFHEGLDFSAPVGTEIYATGDGVVTSVKYSRRGYGNRLEIDHGYNYKTVYAHCADFNVKRGEKIKRGQVIGHVGNTGKSTAPHLHYEVRKSGKPVNPIYYFFNDLTPGQFERIIELSKLPSQTLD